MTEALQQALVESWNRLQACAAEDATLRGHLKVIAESLIRIADETGPGMTGHRADGLSAASEPPQREEPVRPARREPLPLLTLGQEKPAEPIAARPAPVMREVHDDADDAPDRPVIADSELPQLERCLRLKAEACRVWLRPYLPFVSRADLFTDPAVEQLQSRARELGRCQLWMLDLEEAGPSEREALERLAYCYEHAADALSLARELDKCRDELREDFEIGLSLLAKALSALRRATLDVQAFAQEPDQDRGFHWLRSRCDTLRVFVPRHMRLNDPADPNLWSEMAAELAAFRETIRDNATSVQKRHKTFSVLRYHAQRLKRTADHHAHDWQKVLQATHELVELGVPPSSTVLRELLMPLIESAPDGEWPRGFDRVVEAIDQYLATRPPADEPADGDEPRRSADVQRVAELLRGKSVVMIGGVCRPYQRDALRRAFELEEFNWISTREHQSIAPFEAPIKRDDVAVVLLAIRWSSHAFGDVEPICRRHGKQFVRLPRGYGVNQVAAQILAQCGERLETCG